MLCTCIEDTVTEEMDPKQAIAVKTQQRQNRNIPWNTIKKNLGELIRVKLSTQKNGKKFRGQGLGRPFVF